MRNRIILAIGLAISLFGRANGQDVLLPQNPTAPLDTEDSTADDAMSTPLDMFVPNGRDRWFTADFLFGWVEGAHLPPLVTTGPSTDMSTAGVLGEAGTKTLLSGTVKQGMAPGFRLGAGYLYDQAYGLGVEAGFMYLPGQSSSFSFGSTDFNNVLARPFIDSTSGDNASEVVAFPGNSTGNISVTVKNGSFYGANLDLSESIWDDNGQRLEALFGYRFADFSDALRIRQHSDLAPSLSGITMLDRLDDFSSSNVFHGLDLGLRSTSTWDRWSLSLLGKISPGNMLRTVDIHGRTTTTFASGASASTPAGLYALSSNSGHHNFSKWTVLPELGGNLNWQMRSNIALRLGYSALFLTKVARSHDQIDFNINPALIGAPAGATPKLPAFLSRQSNMWIQTLNLGVDVTF